MTLEIITHHSLRDAWGHLKIDPKDVAKIAVGPKEHQEPFTEWEAVLSEIIVGDALGVDRMDYLLRDSHHAGVAYGRFDHYRLIDTMRILPKPWDSDKPALGVEEGGLHSVEALLLARYFMFSQLYLHHIRRIYDYHLKEFLKSWLENGFFSTNVDAHLRMTDNEVWAALCDAEGTPSLPGHDSAMRIVQRKHFKRFYDPTPEDMDVCLEPARAVHEAAARKFGKQNVFFDHYNKAGSAPDFPVMAFDGSIVHSHKISEVMRHIPKTTINYVFIQPDLYEQANAWLEENRAQVIKQVAMEEEA